MARDIESSISELRVAMDNMARQIQSTGAFSFSSLERSNKYAKVQSLINTASKIDQAMEAMKRASDILRAQEAMRQHPGAWKTTSEYLDSEKKAITRRNKLQDALLGIADPRALGRKRLEEEYGEEGAARISAAETYSRIDEARRKIELQKFIGKRAFESDLSPEYLRRHRDLVERYGGGAEGESFANTIEDRERSQRRSSMRWRQRANLAKLDMSDYDLFIHEHKADYGGVKGADEAYRKLLLKQLPPFFKDSRLSTKSLIDIGKLIKSARGIPLVGKLMHPAGLALAGLGVMDALFRASNASNRAVTGWSGSRMLSGSPSKQFDAMARLAGAKDEQEVLKMYGSLIGQFGSESVFASIGAALKSAPPGIARLQMAKSLGLDEKQANMLMFLAGQKPLESTKEAQETAARKSVLEDIQEWGLRSGSSFIEKIRAASLMLPFEKDLEARGMSWEKNLHIASISRDMLNPLTWPIAIIRLIRGRSDIGDTIDEGIKRQIESQDAAESYDVYESNGGPTATNTQNIRSASVYIQNMEVASNNPEEFSKGLADIAVSTPGANRALLASFGSGFTA